MDIIWGSLKDKWLLYLGASTLGYLTFWRIGMYAHEKHTWKHRALRTATLGTKGASPLMCSRYLCQLLPYSQSWLAVSHVVEGHYPTRTWWSYQEKHTRYQGFGFFNVEWPPFWTVKDPVGLVIYGGEKGTCGSDTDFFTSSIGPELVDLCWRFGHSALLCQGTLCTYYSQNVHLRTNAKDFHHVYNLWITPVLNTLFYNAWGILNKCWL